MTWGRFTLKARPDFLGRPTGTGESSLRRPSVIAIRLRNVEHDTVHRPVHLVEELPIPLLQPCHHGPQPRGRLKCLPSYNA
jgi:hypothetical protein